MIEDWIVPEWPAPGRVRALVTTRAGGASTGPYASFNLGMHVGDDARAVERNRAALRRFLPAEPAWMKQVHGARVIEADPLAQVREADGAFARASGRVCAVLSADCLPVLFADSDGTAVGIAHAGWRGMAAGVIERVVGAMQAPPESLLCYLGPAIGASAYEVGADVREAFCAADAGAQRAFAACGDAKYLCDLYLLARQRLARLGVRRIHGGGLCTFSDPARFYSFRRDRATGRMASLVWLE